MHIQTVFDLKKNNNIHNKLDKTNNTASQLSLIRPIYTFFLSPKSVTY